MRYRRFVQHAWFNVWIGLLISRYGVRLADENVLRKSLHARNMFEFGLYIAGVGLLIAVAAVVQGVQSLRRQRRQRSAGAA